MSFKAGKYSSVVLLATILAICLACSKAPDDSQVTSEIQSKLNEDSGLHGKPITVQTAAGVVTLSGTVENETQREAAARYASAVPGIKQVVNNLQTAPLAIAPTEPQVEPQVSIAPPPTPKKVLPAPRKSAARHSERHRTTQEPAKVAASLPPPAPPDTMTADEKPAPVATTPPPPPPAPKKVTVPAGTSVAIRLLDPIDSEKAQLGDTFRATLDAPLPSNDTAVPAGYDVKGHIVEVKSAGKFAGQSLLVLQLDSISVSGKSYGIETDPYRRQGSNRTTNTAKKVGAGAAIGAIIGGIAGGGKGAGIGAAAGGGIGGGVQAAGKGEQIVLPSEAVLSFNLRSPLTITLADGGPDSSRQKLDSPQ